MCGRGISVVCVVGVPKNCQFWVRLRRKLLPVLVVEVKICTIMFGCLILVNVLVGEATRLNDSAKVLAKV
jgi:hypothetical protein